MKLVTLRLYCIIAAIAIIASCKSEDEKFADETYDNFKTIIQNDSFDIMGETPAEYVANYHYDAAKKKEAQNWLSIYKQHVKNKEEERVRLANAKYTLEESNKFMEKFDGVIKKYATPKTVNDIGDAKNQIYGLGLDWNFNISQNKIDSTYPAFITKMNKAVRVLEEFQTEMYPKYRQTFANYAKELLWKDDCEARVVSTDNLTLVLSGNYFLPNRNKEDTYNKLKAALEKFRFKKIMFKWYMSDDKWTSYNINSFEDTEVVLSE